MNLNEFEKRISQNADTLISMGVKNWFKERRTKKKAKLTKKQEDQLREIEDSLVEDFP